MKMTSLMENHSCRIDCECDHGLSLFLETEKHKIMFDMGPNDIFFCNAQKLGVDVSTADIAFLSHGHYDHGGGMDVFCRENKTAPILISAGAFATHSVEEEKGGYHDIGLPLNYQEDYKDRLITVDGAYDEEITVFTAIEGEKFLTAATKSLLEKTEEGYISDPFTHEQNMILRSGGKTYLLAGCAHRGIVNIIETGEKMIGGEFDYVISGFHLTNPSKGIDEPEELIMAVGEELKKREKTNYITGHCTGDEPYYILKGMLGGRLKLMSVGSVFEL